MAHQEEARDVVIEVIEVVEQWYAKGGMKAELIQRITAALAAPRLRWTREKPVKAGWYWMSSIVGGSPSIMKIIDGDDMLVALDDGIEKPVQAFNKAYEWAGPLEMPEEKA